MNLSKMLSIGLLCLAVGTALAKPPKAGGQPRTAVVKMANHKYSVAQAEAIALKKCPGKVVGHPSLAKASGKWEYAVYDKTSKGLLCVSVNADTGKIDKVVKGTGKKPGRGPKRAGTKNTTKAKAQ
jgi:hypothetical protein